MSETKWTPGPWSLIQGNNLGGFSAILHRPGRPKTYFQIAPLADAHLIAAAPELYEALDSLLRMNDAGIRPRAPRDKARAALAKARGQS